MIFDTKIAKKAQCDIIEKRQCISLISKLVEISEKARREGLLGIEDILDTITNPLLIKGLELVIDGTDQKAVKDILLNYIYFGRAEGRILLEQCIICEGILAIQEGENPKIVREKLVAYLGGLDTQGSENWNFLNEVENKFKEDEQCKLKQYLENIKDKRSYSENTRILDEFIPNLKQEEILAILREIDSASLSIGLAGASGRVITKLFNSVSEAYKPFLMDDLERYQKCDVKDIIDNQSKVLTVYNKLKENRII